MVSRRRGLCELATWLCEESAENNVCHLKKALYELKQAPRAWYSCFDGDFMKNGFKRCLFEHTLYIKEGDQGKFLMVCLYVEDLIFTGNSTSMCDEFMRTLMCEFEMADMSLLYLFLEIEVKQQEDEEKTWHSGNLAKGGCWKYKLDSLFPFVSSASQNTLNLTTNFSCSGYIGEYSSSNEQARRIL